jgi:GNAT superfamily N-acetyltransferase
MKVEIRQAHAEDIAAVLALYAQPGMDNGKVLALEEAKALFAQFAKYPNYRLFVALVDGLVVGSYALLVMHNLGHLGTPSAIAEDVVVAQDVRGQGIGRQMMEHAAAQAREAGCYKLALSSNNKRVDAHRFYASLGFVPHGVSFVMEL